MTAIEGRDRMPPLVAGVAVAVAAMVLLAWRLNTLPLTDGDSTFYAKIARNVVESGDWIALRFNQAAASSDVDKPPLGIWLMAASFLLLGPTDLAARLWHTAAASGVLLLTWQLGTRVYGKRAAFYAVVVLLFSGQFFYQAREPLLDIPLTLFLTGTLWLAVAAGFSPSAKHVCAAAALIGLGVMTKGPVAIVLAGVPAAGAAFWLRRADWKMSPRVLRVVLAAIGLFAAIVVPWHIAAWNASGTQFMNEYAGTLSWRRYFTPVHTPGAGMVAYPAFLLAGLLPWTGFVAPAAVAAWRGRHERPAGVFLGAYAFWVLLFFAASPGSIFMRYLLPALPAVAVLIGAFLDRPESSLSRVGAAGSIAAGSILLLAAAFGLRDTLPGANVLRLTLPILAAGAVAGGALLLRGGSVRAAVSTMAAGATIAYTLLLALVPPVVASLLPERDFARHVNALESSGARLAVFKPESLESMLAFYVRTPITRIDDGPSLERFLSEHDLAFVVERPGKPVPSTALRLHAVRRTPSASLLCNAAPRTAADTRAR